MGGGPASSSSDPDITSSADAGILCRPLHPVPSAPGPLFSSTALRRLSEGLSTNSYGHREEGGARTIVAGQNSSGVALPKRQPKRADFCPISPATILGLVVVVVVVGYEFVSCVSSLVPLSCVLSMLLLLRAYGSVFVCVSSERGSSFTSSL